MRQKPGTAKPTAESMVKGKGRPLASVTACSFVFNPPFVRPIRRSR